jgi:predicted  nucleic acid-binding Zn-ribbon protein
MLPEAENAVKQMNTTRSDTRADTQPLEILCQRLLLQQPQAQSLLKRLLSRSDCAFALVRDGRCSACNVTIATARAQTVKAGGFINCANCSRFLYCEPSCPT